MSSLSQEEEEEEEEEEVDVEERDKLLDRYVDYVCGKVAALSSEDQQALREITELPTDRLDRLENDALSSVASIDLSYFTSVTQIGSGFLRAFSSLQSVNLSALSGVARIDDYFLQATGIQSVDLSPLKLLNKMPKQSLSWCKKLQKLDLSVIPQLEEIDHCVCEECSSLTTVNMSGMTQLKEIGSRFLYQTGLTSIDFSNTAPERIGSSFLNSTKVQNLDLSDLLSKVVRISCVFLYRCSNLVEIDLSSCCNHVTEIKECFACGCTSLTKISLSGLTSLKKIEREFLNECSSLIELDLSCCSNLEILDKNFCTSCTSLETLNMSYLPCLKKISSGFMTECRSLTSVDFTGTENLQGIGESAFVGCISLAKLDMDFLSNADKIGKNFLCKERSVPVKFGFKNSLKTTTALVALPCEFSNLHKLANVEAIESTILKQKVKTAVEKAAVRQMIVRMVYTLGFRTSKLVPAGKAIRASRPRRLVIEFLLPPSSIDVPFKWGFGDEAENEPKKSFESQIEEAQKREEAANARTRVAQSKLLEKQEEILELQEKLLVGVIKKYL